MRRSPRHARKSVSSSARLLAMILGLALSYGCRSGRPAANESPLAAGTSLTDAHTIRSVLRVRALVGGETHSFRAQLLLQPAVGRMELDAYTPLGTAAATIYADRTRAIFIDHIDHTTWNGTPAELGRSLPVLGGVAPADWAAAVIGYRVDGVSADYDGSPTAATIPAPHVTITHGADRLEITNLETYTSNVEVTPPDVPRDYRCCVPPRL